MDMKPAIGTMSSSNQGSASTFQFYFPETLPSCLTSPLFHLSTGQPRSGFSLLATLQILLSSTWTPDLAIEVIASNSSTQLCHFANFIPQLQSHPPSIRTANSPLISLFLQPSSGGNVSARSCLFSCQNPWELPDMWGRTGRLYRQGGIVGRSCRGYLRPGLAWSLPTTFFCAIP